MDLNERVQFQRYKHIRNITELHVKSCMKLSLLHK